MANVFKATQDIVQEMADDFKSITGITLSPSQIDDPRVLKWWTNAGAVSSFYSQLQRQVNDFFAPSASVEGLIKLLRAKQLPDQATPQFATGQIQITFSAAAEIKVGQQIIRVSDGAVFNAIQGATGDQNTPAIFFVQAAEAGDAGNLDELSQPFTVDNPPVGVNAACTNVSLFLDGRDIESGPEMLDRIQTYDRSLNSGGNTVAYEAWAKAASPEVVTAKCLPLLRGPDTVDVVITAGTTNIAAAVAAGQSITRLPAASLIATVQAYITALNPVTDSVLVRAPVELPFNVTFNYSLYTETVANRAYVNSQIQQILAVLIYSANPLDVMTPTQIERLVDQSVGSLIKERVCTSLGGGTTAYQVPQANILKPGVITLGALS